MKLEKPENMNYSAEVVILGQPRKHSNADRLQCWTILGSNVITAMEAQPGDTYVYFPVECQLSPKFLSLNNLYRHEDRNADKASKGYFEDNGRIKAVKLRGEASEGLIMPLSSLATVCPTYRELKPGDVFDALNGEWVCKKYMRPNQRTPGQPGTKQARKERKFSKIIASQFNFHKDTENFKRSLLSYYPDDFVSITYKLHGTSGVSARVLCRKKPKTIKEKVFAWFGKEPKGYDDVCSSRSVIKNDFQESVGFYSDNIWLRAHDELKDKITEGMTLYYEIVGFLPSGGAIQGKYDYGCKPGEHKVYIYRGTYTAPDGSVLEFSTRQLFAWCEAHEIAHVPLLWEGKLSDLVPSPNSSDFDILNVWRDELLKVLVSRFNEKPCYMCSNKLPEEGVVIRKENVLPGQWKAHKLKSFAFLEGETKALDAGTENIEDSEAAAIV